MLPFLARKYIYRYLIVAIGLPLAAKVLMKIGRTVENRSGEPTVVSKSLKKTGRFAQRRTDKSAGKDRRTSH